MTNEQYKRAVEISNKIKDYENFKTIIAKYHISRLTYAYKSITGEWRFFNESVMKLIGDLIKRHDEMLRQEIDEDIQKLKDEIKTL